VLGYGRDGEREKNKEYRLCKTNWFDPVPFSSENKNGKRHLDDLKCDSTKVGYSESPYRGFSKPPKEWQYRNIGSPKLVKQCGS